jgi:hypothetical protein
LLSRLTLRNLANEDVVIHDDTPTSKRLLITAKGLAGVAGVRQAKRVRPSAHGSINQSRWEEGRTITLEGEVVSQASIEDAIAQFRAIAGVAHETLRAPEEKGTLLKWTEGLPAEVVNLLQVTPSWEGGVGSYAAEGGTVAQSTEQAFSGTHSLACTKTGGAGNLIPFYNTELAGSHRMGPVEAGKKYTYSAYVRAKTTTRRVYARINWYNASNTFLSVSEQSNGFEPEGAWFRVSVTHEAPAEAAYYRAEVKWESAAESEVHYVDAQQFTQTEATVPYADGGLAGYRWSGTAEASSTEKINGQELQRLVKLDGELDPIYQEAAARLVYQVVFFAEDPRAYSQRETSKTSPSLSVTEVENAWIGSTAKANKGVVVNSEHVYWGSAASHVGRAAIGGTGVEATWIATGASVTDVEVNASNTFWTSSLGIGRATLAGATIETEWRKLSEITTSGLTPASLTADASHIYWLWGTTTHNEYSIGRMALAGGSIEKEWIKGEGTQLATENGGLVVNSEHVYWAHGGFIGRATISGGSIEPEWINVGSAITGLAVNATYIYWTTTTGRIGRAKLGAEEQLTAFLTVSGHATGLAIDAAHIYWPQPNSEDVGRATLAGGGEGEAFTLTQNGNRPTPLTLKIHGPIKNPALVRHSDGTRMALEGEIPSGNYLEINGASRTAKLNGGSNALYFVNPTESNWEVLELANGAGTSFSLAASSATAATVEAFWRDAYS